MGFLSGSVTFERFRVTDDPTSSFGEDHVELLKKYVIDSASGNIYEQPALGFIGGAHLLDTSFEVEKNIIGEAMHFGVRIDSCQIPSPIKRAWMHQELKAIGADNPSGRPTKQQRQEAKDAVEARCADEAEKGNFKKLSEIPILWDAKTDTILIGCTSEKTNEACLGLMEQAFGISVSRVTAGTLAMEYADANDLNEAMFATSPTNFLPELRGEANTGVVWWNGMSDNYDYLGNEFLLWLWWNWETQSDTIALEDGTEASGMFARSLSLDCPEGEHGKESISSESPVALPEAKLAIRMGKQPRKAGLSLVREGNKYDFALQAETFSIGSAKIGSADDSQTASRDLVDRIESIREFADTLEMLYSAFCAKRIGKSWVAEAKKITSWLSDDSSAKRRRAA